MAAVKVPAAMLARFKSGLEKAEKRVRAIREKGEAVVEQATRTAVVSGAAFGLGVVQGRTGGIELPGGIPLDLAVGVGAHAAGFFKVGGKHSHQLHNIGDGALALYAGTMGRSVGVHWKATGKLGGFKSSGELPESGTDFMSDADLARSVLAR